MINNIANSQSANTSRTILPDKKQTKSDQAAQTSANNYVSSSNVDTVDTGSSTKAVVYSKSEISNSKSSNVKQYLADMAAENLRYLVDELIQNQGKLGKNCVIGVNDIAHANQAISEDGAFGVEAVSDRIVSFAIAISGNDKTKLATLKAAIQDGFEKAGKALGGTLPDICNQTYEATMKKLDNWAGTEESI